ncbi:MAG: hypothetical protein JWM80_5662, partial [Cyanobacteria bacterium RYN_339]|nr:hypothetical protein [Cyanobacteria bacterium RYN_339]
SGALAGGRPALGQPGAGAQPGSTRLGAPGAPGPRGAQPLNAPGGPSRLGASARSGQLPNGKAPGVAIQSSEAVDGGSRVAYSNKTVMQYEHKPDARFLPGNAPPADPREDFAESFQAFMTNPQALLKASPEKFLFLNAESRQFPPAKVLEMAKTAGIDLTQVVTSLLVGGRASQAMIDRMCEFHGISGDKVALLAKDQELLAKGANLDGLVERLALDLGVNGAATTKLLKVGEQLRDKYHGLVGQLPVTKDADGLGQSNRIVSWLVGKATGGDRLERLDKDLSEVRTQFTKLPLAVQLRTDPRMAMGANWFALSTQERAMLSNPEQLQQLVARAAAKSEDRSYIPQNLTANEKAQLANRTMVDALFDPSSEGEAFRAKLTGPNPKQALEELRAKNGDKVMTLLSDGQKKSLLDARNIQAIKEMLDTPEASGARGVLRDGTTGAEQLKAALLRFQMGEARQSTDLKVQLEGVLGQVKGVREKLITDMGGSPLEVALTEVNRQVQEGNMPFIQKFLNAKGEKGLEAVLGAWVAQALTPAEKKLFEDGDYRRHLVQNAEQIRSTGLSLADEARQYKTQTATIQDALSVLLRPDNKFREEFERDPVMALKAHGLWVNLPDPIQQQLADGDRKIKLSKLVEAVQESMSPIILRQAGYQLKLDNLKSAILGVNAGNYGGMIKLMDLGAPELQRTVKSGLAAAMAGEAKHKAGGPLSFV